MKGTMNDFQYSKAPFNYKENIGRFNKKYNRHLIFEKIGILAPTSKYNLNLKSKFSKIITFKILLIAKI